MHHNVIKNSGRGQHQSVIKRKCSAAAAASPACFLVPDGYFIVAAAGELMKICDPRRNIFVGGLAVTLFQGGDLILFTDGENRRLGNGLPGL